MFKLSKNSLAFDGAQSDQLSYQTCKILLGLPNKFKVMEIIYAKGSVFTQHCIFTLGGAHYQDILLNGVKIEQNQVYEAHINDTLDFVKLLQGFRLYLMACPFDPFWIGSFRGRFNDYFNSAHKKIRLIKGPEFSFLENPSKFLAQAFVISQNSDLSGIRLIGEKINALGYDIASSIVDDGLIQLTPNGPIVLLRQGQVTGGYPRIFSVIKTDLDFLVQYKMGMVVHFELIDLSVAKTLLLNREMGLQNLKKIIFQARD